MVEVEVVVAEVVGGKKENDEIGRKIEWLAMFVV